jgi:KaiC/GvpD/RAD55 family RecA-like ATPase
MIEKLKFIKNQVTVVIISNKAYKNKEMEVVKSLAGKSKTGCYVNVTHSFDSLLKELHKHKIDENKFLFIDAMSQDSGHKNCIHIGSPRALTKLSLTIKKVLLTKKFDTLLFDSLSSLCVYHEPENLTRFVHDLFSEIKKSKITAVFTMQAGTNKNFIGDVSMFADQVIEVK